MNDRIEAAITGAFCSKGANKGYLKAKCPPMGTDAAIYWQAVVAVVNPYKMGIMHLMFMTPEQSEFYDVCVKKVEGERKSVRIAMDRDREALEKMGVW